MAHERRAGMIELANAVTNLTDKVDQNIKATNKINDTLHGNGGDGLVTRMRLQEEMTQENHNSILWARRTTIKVLGGGFILGLIGLMFWAFRQGAGAP